MRSRILSNGWKWLAGQRARCLVNSSLGLSTRVGTSDLQAGFAAERERSLYNESRIINFPLFSRVFSSKTLEDSSASDADESEERPTRHPGNKDSKKFFLLQLRFRSDAVAALQEWMDKGKSLTLPDLRHVVRTLRRNKHYERALEVSEWMQKHKDFEPEAGYYAVHMHLIAKVHGLAHAEKYYADLPKNAKNQKTYGALLHCYVQEQSIEKAEQQMEKMEELGFVTDEHNHSEMMRLYMAIGQADKVLLQVKRMKETNVPLDTKTYNLWMNACVAMSDIYGVEKIVDEIKAGGENNVHWRTYSILAKIYINAGLVGKAETAVKELEKKIPHGEVAGYDSLITLYGALGNKEEVHRIWQSVKKGFKNPFFSSYRSVLTSLVKIGDIEGAEKIFEERESSILAVNCKLSNILLDAYVKKGMLEKAELFHGNVSEKKCYLNGRTWEILTEGYLQSKQMSKAVVSMEKALTVGKSKEWQPKSENVMGILKHFEEQGNVEDAEKFLGLLRRFKCLTTEFYNSLLSTYIKAGKAAPKVVEKMAEDSVSPDEETDRLLKLVNE